MSDQVLAQAEPSGGGGISITLPTPDWTTLVPNVVSLVFDAVGQWLQKTSHSALDGLWSGDHNVIGQTPLAMTWSFGAVQAQVADVQSAARAVLLFALVLLGLKSMLGGMIHSHSDVLGEFINGVLASVILVAAFPLVIPMCIGLVNAATGAVAGGAGLSSYVAAGQGGLQDPFIGGILFVILAFFAVRLLVKAVWRIGFLAVLLPVGAAACALYAIPQTRWLLSWWARTWGGMLAAQIPSVFALAIGLGMFAGGGGGGLGPFVYSIAFLQLATDLYSLIPFGSAPREGAPWGSLPWRAPLAALGAGVGTAGGAAATLARTEARYPWPAGATAGRVGDMYGYQ